MTPTSNDMNNHQYPNPPPRILSRPNQPPPPPPLPTVPPVPPTRDSSIAISKATIDNNKAVLTAQLASNISPLMSNDNNSTTGGSNFIEQFQPLFHPIEELPPPEMFTNKDKTYPSQRALQKRQN